MRALQQALLVTCASALVMQQMGSGLDNRIFVHVTAMFGKQQPYEANGKVVLANPVEMCEKSDQDYTGQIVVVLRGNCSFISKAYFAQAKGAIAVVVANNVTGQDPVRMGASEEDRQHFAIHVPAVFVADYVYQAVHDLPGGWEGQVNAKGDLASETLLGNPLKTAGILLLLLPLLWCAMAAVYLALKIFFARRAYYVRHQRAAEMPLVPFRRFREENEASRVVEMAFGGPAVINDACAICLDEFEASESVKLLPCSHGFHACCLDPWLERSDLCPICKASILEVPAARTSPSPPTSYIPPSTPPPAATETYSSVPSSDPPIPTFTPSPLPLVALARPVQDITHIVQLHLDSTPVSIHSS